MLRRLLLAVALVWPTPSGGVASALRLNGWYPCTATGASDDLWSTILFAGVQFECAKLELPLCHAGVCESARTMEVFVKRKLARVRPAAKTVWFLEGGPGASSKNMEIAMLLTTNLLNQTVNVYTMDHRGTGRSGFLQCEAAQALDGGSPGGANLELEELANCARDVLFEIHGHTAAYSVTSAAHDVAAVLAYLEDVAEYPGEDSNVFLYGVSYGTYLVERVMHLSPPQVRGYIVDGVLAETGFAAVEWNKNILPPTKRFLQACFDSPACPLHFQSRDTVVEEVLAMYEQIDAAAAAGGNACAQGLSFLAAEGDDAAAPSASLRLAFSLLVRDPKWRTLVPSLIKRVVRCNDQDEDELPLAFQAIKQRLQAQYGGASSSALPWAPPLELWASSAVAPRHKFLEISPTSAPSTMLYYLITFSELWQLSMPTLDALMDEFENGPFSLNVDTLPAYCLLSGGFQSKDRDEMSTCGQLRESWEQLGEDTSELPAVDEPFLYAHDQYWNATATLPDDVGALFLVGGLDFQTPSELGRREYQQLDARNKMLVEFDFGGHGCGFVPTMPHDALQCGPQIIASFILHDGDVAKVDTHCVALLPDLVFDDKDFKELVAEVRAVVEEHAVLVEQSGSGEL